jgi:hypothetical protein
VEVAHGTPSTSAVDSARLPPPPDRTAPDWRGALQPLGIVALVGAGCAYVAIMNPNESGAYPQCPLRSLAGYDCPGCGLTRAVYALMHADPVRAIDHNLLVVLLLPLAIVAFARWTATRLGYPRRTLPRWRPWMSLGVGVAFFAFLVVRNLPGLEWLRSSAG